MSILNKMLRDLEQRQQGEGTSAALPAANSISRDDSRPLWLNILLVLSAVLLLFAVYAILNRPAVIPVVSEIALTEPPALSSEPVPQPAPEQLSAESAGLTTTPGAAAIEMVIEPPQMNEDVLAPVEQASGTVPSAPVAKVLHEPESVSASASVKLTDTDTAMAPAQYKNAGSTRNVITTQSIAIQRPEQTAQQQATALQQQAVLASQAGELPKALSLWQNVQLLIPQHPTAYTAQAQIWRQLGQADKAQYILQQGLNQGADSADLRLLLAQYHVQQQQWAAADAVLQPQFDLTLHTEYYGLKATAAQQLGDSAGAQHWFAQLIVLQPQQARWWLGAGIAFDQTGQHQQAQLHYRQALQWGDNLSVESRNYIQQRLAAIE